MPSAVPAGDGAPDARRLGAAADLYHTYFTGLILTLVSRRNGTDAAEWVFRVFRHQHHEKFLSSFVSSRERSACTTARPRASVGSSVRIP
jgi:hypothetical protein